MSWPTHVKLERLPAEGVSGIFMKLMAMDHRKNPVTRGRRSGPVCTLWTDTEEGEHARVACVHGRNGQAWSVVHYSHNTHKMAVNQLAMRRDLWDATHALDKVVERWQTENKNVRVSWSVESYQNLLYENERLPEQAHEILDRLLHMQAEEGFVPTCTITNNAEHPERLAIGYFTRGFSVALVKTFPRGHKALVREDAMSEAANAIRQELERWSAEGLNARVKYSTRRFYQVLGESEGKTLYLSRTLQNYDDLIEWAKSQGFKNTLAPDELHVTIAWSETPVDWDKVGARDDNLTVPAGGHREVKPLGDKGAIVLKFESDELEARWQETLDAGAHWKHDGYQAHVTITYEGAEGLDLDAVEPYEGELVFGPEELAEVDEDWDKKIQHAESVVESGMERVPEDLGEVVERLSKMRGTPQCVLWYDGRKYLTVVRQHGGASFTVFRWYGKDVTSNPMDTGISAARTAQRLTVYVKALSENPTGNVRLKYGQGTPFTESTMERLPLDAEDILDRLDLNRSVEAACEIVSDSGGKCRVVGQPSHEHASWPRKYSIYRNGLAGAYMIGRETAIEHLRGLVTALASEGENVRIHYGHVDTTNDKFIAESAAPMRVPSPADLIDVLREHPTGVAFLVDGLPQIVVTSQLETHDDNGNPIWFFQWYDLSGASKPPMRTDVATMHQIFDFLDECEENASNVRITPMTPKQAARLRKSQPKPVQESAAMRAPEGQDLLELFMTHPTGVAFVTDGTPRFVVVSDYDEDQPVALHWAFAIRYVNHGGIQGELSYGKLGMLSIFREYMNEWQQEGVNVRVAFMTPQQAHQVCVERHDNPLSESTAIRIGDEGQVLAVINEHPEGVFFVADGRPFMGVRAFIDQGPPYYKFYTIPADGHVHEHHTYETIHGVLTIIKQNLAIFADKGANVRMVPGDVRNYGPKSELTPKRTVYTGMTESAERLPETPFQIFKRLSQMTTGPDFKPPMCTIRTDSGHSVRIQMVQGSHFVLDVFAPDGTITDYSSSRDPAPIMMDIEHFVGAAQQEGENVRIEYGYALREARPTWPNLGGIRIVDIIQVNKVLDKNPKGVVFTKDGRPFMLVRDGASYRPNIVYYKIYFIRRGNRMVEQDHDALSVLPTIRRELEKAMAEGTNVRVVPMSLEDFRKIGRGILREAKVNWPEIQGYEIKRMGSPRSILAAHGEDLHPVYIAVDGELDLVVLPVEDVDLKTGEDCTHYKTASVVMEPEGLHILEHTAEQHTKAKILAWLKDRLHGHRLDGKAFRVYVPVHPEPVTEAAPKPPPPQAPKPAVRKPRFEIVRVPSDDQLKAFLEQIAKTGRRFQVLVDGKPVLYVRHKQHRDFYVRYGEDHKGFRPGYTGHQWSSVATFVVADHIKKILKKNETEGVNVRLKVEVDGNNLMESDGPTALMRLSELDWGRFDRTVEEYCLKRPDPFGMPFDLVTTEGATELHCWGNCIEGYKTSYRVRAWNSGVASSIGGMGLEKAFSARLSDAMQKGWNLRVQVPADFYAMYKASLTEGEAPDRVQLRLSEITNMGKLFRACHYTALQGEDFDIRMVLPDMRRVLEIRCVIKLVPNWNRRFRRQVSFRAKAVTDTDFQNVSGWKSVVGEVKDAVRYAQEQGMNLRWDMPASVHKTYNNLLRRNRLTESESKVYRLSELQKLLDDMTRRQHKGDQPDSWHAIWVVIDGIPRYAISPHGSHNVWFGRAQPGGKGWIYHQEAEFDVNPRSKHSLDRIMSDVVQDAQASGYNVRLVVGENPIVKRVTEAIDRRRVGDPRKVLVDIPPGGYAVIWRDGVRFWRVVRRRTREEWRLDSWEGTKWNIRDMHFLPIDAMEQWLLDKLAKQRRSRLSVSFHQANPPAVPVVEAQQGRTYRLSQLDELMDDMTTEARSSTGFPVKAWVIVDGETRHCLRLSYSSPNLDWWFGRATFGGQPPHWYGVNGVYSKDALGWKLRELEHEGVNVRFLLGARPPPPTDVREDALSESLQRVTTGKDVVELAIAHDKNPRKYVAVYAVNDGVAVPQFVVGTGRAGVMIWRDLNSIDMRKVTAHDRLMAATHVEHLIGEISKMGVNVRMELVDDPKHIRSKRMTTESKNPMLRIASAEDVMDLAAGKPTDARPHRSVTVYGDGEPLLVVTYEGFIPRPVHDIYYRLQWLSGGTVRGNYHMIANYVKIDLEKAMSEGLNCRMSLNGPKLEEGEAARKSRASDQRVSTLQSPLDLALKGPNGQVVITSDGTPVMVIRAVRRPKGRPRVTFAAYWVNAENGSLVPRSPKESADTMLQTVVDWSMRESKNLRMRLVPAGDRVELRTPDLPPEVAEKAAIFGPLGRR